MAKLAIDVVLNKVQAMTGLRGMEKDFTSFGKSVLGAVGLGGGMAGLVAGIDAILARAGQLQDVSDAFNVSAESIQRLANVGVTANLSIEEIGNKLGKLGKAAQEAAGDNAGLAATFAKIGVSGQDLLSSSPEELFNKLREAVSSGSLAGEELKVVNELLAKDFQRFLPILRMTTEEFTRLGGASGVMSDAMVASLDAANVSLRQFQQFVTTETAMILSGFLDLAKDLKNNPVDFARDLFTNYEGIEARIGAEEKKLTDAILQERKQRAGKIKAVEDEAEINKRDKSEASQELKLLEQGIAGREAALKMSAQNDEDRIKTNLDNFKQAEQEKMSLLKERLGLLPDLEELQAERAGPDAERQLLRKRAQEAGDQARKTGNIEDVTRAQQAALAFQRAKESQLRSQGFGDAATASARAQASQVVGPLPGAAELGQALAASKASADELAKAQSAGTKQQEKLTVVLDRMQQMANKAGGLSSLMPGPVEESFAATDESSTGALGDLPGIGELFDFKKLLNDLSNPAAPQNLPIELANPPDLKPIMDKLDELIKNAGVFS